MKQVQAGLTDASVARIELEFDINAPHDTVWSALVESPGDWWPGAHHAAGPDSRMVFEPRPGGRFYEDDGKGGGLLWYTVLAIAPPTSVTLAGYIAPPWGGPATSLLTLSLKPVGERTMLKVLDSLFGSVDEKFAESTHAGWQQILGEALRAHVERR